MAAGLPIAEWGVPPRTRLPALEAPCPVTSGHGPRRWGQKDGTAEGDTRFQLNSQSLEVPLLSPSSEGGCGQVRTKVPVSPVSALPGHVRALFEPNLRACMTALFQLHIFF